jgi:hypothetical protein
LYYTDDKIIVFVSVIIFSKRVGLVQVLEQTCYTGPLAKKMLIDAEIFSQTGAIVGSESLIKRQIIFVLRLGNRGVV